MDLDRFFFFCLSRFAQFEPIFDWLLRDKNR